MSEKLGVVKDQIRQFVLENLARPAGVTELADDESLMKSGVVDSLGIFRLVAFLEDTFALRIADEEISQENYQSIDAMGRFVIKKVGSRE